MRGAADLEVLGLMSWAGGSFLEYPESLRQPLDELCLEGGTAQLCASKRLLSAGREERRSGIKVRGEPFQRLQRSLHRR